MKYLLVVDGSKKGYRGENRDQGRGCFIKAAPKTKRHGSVSVPKP